MSKKRLAKSDYTIGWVCALSHEMAAAISMLDDKHEDLEEQDISDHNSYQLGRIHHHNIVIASLPAGTYGTTSAATVAKDLLRTFPSIRFGLMVGIGGAVPSLNHDIRLGDVVVSKPHGASGGVIQYDRGKLNPGGTFQRTGSLNSPPKLLLTALTRLQAGHQIEGNKISSFLHQASQNYPKLIEGFAFPGRSHDRLFQVTYEHLASNTNTMCEMCDFKAEIHREPRKDNDSQIHYGIIASSNQVMKDGVMRDQLGAELDVLCFEMEAAGLMLDFPCLVIRGICDYSDSHKNERWQKYAAAVAAGFATELLGVLSPKSVQKEKAIVQVSGEDMLN